MTDLPAPAILDLALRGAAVAVLLLLGSLLLRDRPRNAAARLGALLALGTAAYAVCSAPGIVLSRAWWHAPLFALASGNALVFWLFARALFDDGLAARPWHVAAWAAFAAGALALFWRPDLPALGTVLAAGRAACALLAVAQTVASWRTDLVEGRRRFRVFAVAAIAVFVLVDTGAGLFGVTAAGAILSSAGLLVMALAIGWPLLRTADGGLFPVSAPAVPPATAAPPAATPLPADGRQLAALQRLMTVERIHRREGLTIGALALQMNLPEYRLRLLINQSLGFRNFNAFLNHYRIAEAKAALADPAQAEVPVLTIALDAGFQSLGPFNRAFRTETGLTPSEYRRQHLAEPGPNPLPAQADFGIGQRA